jgi:hypothetical protein
MKHDIVLALSCLIELLAMAACTTTGKGINPTASATNTVTAVAEDNTSAIRVLPTPASPGRAVVQDSLQVAMESAELTSDYITEYGTSREPPAGQKFLWVEVTLKNIGPRAHDLPAIEHYSVLYGGAELKPTYGHRKDHPDYTSLVNTVSPGQSLVAWLRFDVPAPSELTALQFAYLPDSSRITEPFSPTLYPWADHPVFLWNLALQ